MFARPDGPGQILHRWLQFKKVIPAVNRENNTKKRRSDPRDMKVYVAWSDGVDEVKELYVRIHVKLVLARIASPLLRYCVSSCYVYL